MKTTITLIGVSVLLCTACQKGGFGYVEGTIYKAGTNIPIENVQVDIIQTHYNNTGQYLKGSYSNENGYFKISYYYKFNANYGYYIRAKPAGSGSDQHEYLQNPKEKVDFYFP